MPRTKHKLILTNDNSFEEFSLTESLLHGLSTESLEKLKILDRALKQPQIVDFCINEWFYSDVDYNFFNINGFISCFSQLILPDRPLPLLTRQELISIRSLRPQPRRLSTKFFSEQLETIKEARKNTRRAQFYLPKFNIPASLLSSIHTPLISTNQLVIYKTKQKLSIGHVVDVIINSNAIFYEIADLKTKAIHKIIDTSVMSVPAKVELSHRAQRLVYYQWHRFFHSQQHVTKSEYDQSDSFSPSLFSIQAQTPELKRPPKEGNEFVLLTPTPQTPVASTQKPISFSNALPNEALSLRWAQVTSQLEKKKKVLKVLSKCFIVLKNTKNEDEKGTLKQQILWLFLHLSQLNASLENNKGGINSFIFTAKANRRNNFLQNFSEFSKYAGNFEKCDSIAKKFDSFFSYCFNEAKTFADTTVYKVAENLEKKIQYFHFFTYFKCCQKFNFSNKINQFVKQPYISISRKETIFSFDEIQRYVSNSKFRFG
eukprot:TRINITY_DN1477_c0_g1_i1.p1 TRINITY_DN1477_c0_g1~~TRINITY_DN1477_c0_g1_i1.p1  ORF type:complete len:486 (-),score=121.57 TRINITY_DN1477_c0_g1_i1:105-1562(-)